MRRDRFRNRTSVLAFILILLISSVISINSLHAAILFSDDFNDGTADGWSEIMGAWAVEGGEYSGFGDQDIAVSIVDYYLSPGRTVVIEADVMVHLDNTGATNGFLVFDYQGPNDFKFAGAVDGADDWAIGNHDTTWHFLIRPDEPELIDTGRWYRLRIEIDGSKATLYVDDDRDGSGFIYKAEYDFGSMGTGRVGMYTIKSHTHYDNFTVEELTPAPVLSLSQPDGVNDAILAGDIYSITYTLDDPDDVVTAAFYYDTDNTGLDGTAITGSCAAAAEGTGVTCSWDTTGMAEGSYYIYGIADDGLNPPVSAYSAGQVTINEPVPAPAYQRIKAIKDKLDAPSAIATDASDRIYVTETSFNRLNIYSPGGHFLKRLKGLDNPFSIAVDSTGRIFIGNGKTGNVEIYDFDFNLLSKLGSGDGEFNIPCAIAIDSTDHIYVADCGEDTIKVYNPDGSFSFSFGGPGNGNGQFNYPSSITIDEIAGEIIIPDTRFVSGMMGAYQAPRIQVFDLSGVHKRTFGIRGVGEGLLFRPESVAVDAEGRIYISDGYQNVVQVFDNTGTYLTPLYDSANPLTNPLGITIGSSNRLFIAVHGSESIEIYGLDNFRDMVVTPLSFIFEGSEGGANPALQNLDISSVLSPMFSIARACDGGTEPFTESNTREDGLTESSGGNVTVNVTFTTSMAPESAVTSTVPL